MLSLIPRVGNEASHLSSFCSLYPACTLKMRAVKILARNSSTCVASYVNSNGSGRDVGKKGGWRMGGQLTSSPSISSSFFSSSSSSCCCCCLIFSTLIFLSILFVSPSSSSYFLFFSLPSLTLTFLFLFVSLILLFSSSIFCSWSCSSFSTFSFQPLFAYFSYSFIPLSYSSFHAVPSPLQHPQLLSSSLSPRPRRRHCRWGR